MPSVDLRDRARAAIDLVGSDPSAALELADQVVAAVPVSLASTGEHEALSIAHRAAGLALQQMPDLVGAEARLRLAVVAATTAELVVVGAEATMSLAFVLLERGRAQEALEALDRVRPRLDGVAAARLGVQRALVLQRGLGRAEDSLEEYSRAIPVLSAAGDLVWSARAHNNRSQLFAYRGDVEPAIADQRRAVELFRATGRSHLAAQAKSDLAWLVGISGRIPESLRLLDEAAEQLPDNDPIARLDRADILMRAGLITDAVTTARETSTWLSERDIGWDVVAAEAELLLAQASLRAGRLDDAVAHAATAERMFRTQGRGSWKVLADYVIEVAALRDDAVDARIPDPSQGHPRSTESTIRELEEQGWRSHGLDLRIAAATRARERGWLDQARDLIDSPVHDPNDLLDVRARTVHAQALRALLDGNRRSAAGALARAWSLTERQRCLVGAAELRAMVSGHSAGIVELALEQAAAHRSAPRVLLWAERGRAATLRFPPALPPDDPQLAGALGHLRLAAHADVGSRLTGHVDRAAATDRARSEQAIVRLTRQSTGSASSLAPVGAADVRDRADGAAFVEYVVIKGDLVAVVVGRRRSSLVPLGPLAAVTSDISRLEFVLRRMASGFGGGRGIVEGRGASTTSSLAAAALDVQRRLLDPVRSLLGDEDVVLSPTGPLWRIPWSTLPHLRGRPVSLAPSATLWCRARDRRMPARPRVLAVAGPRLAAAQAEVEAVRSAYSGVVTLQGADADAASVTRELRLADVAHLAVHGTLRADNPLFSTLELADGPLTGYDLERLSPMPHTMILPACHSGEGRALAPDEVLGLAWTLLGAGASSVVATLTAVPDAPTADLMSRLHRALSTGASPATALAGAQADTDPADALAVAAAAAFVVTGS